MRKKKTVNIIYSYRCSSLTLINIIEILPINMYKTNGVPM